MTPVWFNGGDGALASGFRSWCVQVEFVGLLGNGYRRHHRLFVKHLGRHVERCARNDNGQQGKHEQENKSRGDAALAFVGLTKQHQVHRIAVVQGVLNGFAWFVQQNDHLKRIEAKRKWCRGWDTNPRTHTGPDLKPGAFDHLSHPCVEKARLGVALE